MKSAAMVISMLLPAVLAQADLIMPVSTPGQSQEVVQEAFPDSLFNATHSYLITFPESGGFFNAAISANYTPLFNFYVIALQGATWSNVGSQQFAGNGGQVYYLNYYEWVDYPRNYAIHDWMNFLSSNPYTTAFSQTASHPNYFGGGNSYNGSNHLFSIACNQAQRFCPACVNGGPASFYNFSNNPNDSQHYQCALLLAF